MIERIEVKLVYADGSEQSFDFELPEVYVAGLRIRGRSLFADGISIVGKEEGAGRQ